MEDQDGQNNITIPIVKFFVSHLLGHLSDTKDSFGRSVVFMEGMCELAK